jgi:dephospho-CoA kinase
MLVVAGPPGSGKSTFFPIAAMGVDAFSIDDRCAQIVGSYREIPPDVRRAVSQQCETFVAEHIDGNRTRPSRRLDQPRARQSLDQAEPSAEVIVARLAVSEEPRRRW